MIERDTELQITSEPAIAYSTCYLLFIFFVIILKIFLKTLVYVNISCIFTP